MAFYVLTSHQQYPLLRASNMYMYVFIQTWGLPSSARATCRCVFESSSNAQWTNAPFRGAVPQSGETMSYFYTVQSETKRDNTVIDVSLILVIWIYSVLISFVLLNISSKFLLHLECYLLSHNRHVKISK